MPQRIRVLIVRAGLRPQLGCCKGQQSVHHERDRRSNPQKACDAVRENDEHSIDIVSAYRGSTDVHIVRFEIPLVVKSIDIDLRRWSRRSSVFSSRPADGGESTHAGKPSDNVVCCGPSAMLFGSDMRAPSRFEWSAGLCDRLFDLSM